MNFPPVMFDASTKARHDDPETSKEAAKSAKSLVEGHHSEIVQCLKDCGPMGVDKIAQYADMDSSQVYRRMKELQKAGWVELTGNTVKADSGRQQREWSVTNV